MQPVTNMRPRRGRAALALPVSLSLAAAVICAACIHGAVSGHRAEYSPERKAAANGAKKADSRKGGRNAQAAGEGRLRKGGAAQEARDMSAAQKEPEVRKLDFYDNKMIEAMRRGIPRDGALLVVDSRDQSLHFMRLGRARQVFPVSTAANGISASEGSGGTPPGWHRVEKRIGEGQPVGRVFVSRAATSRILSPTERRAERGTDAVSTRILWLKGMEPGVNLGGNVDSFRRYIYIHGTDQEQLLGSPASHGCIRMSNTDVLDLYNQTAGIETWVFIR